MYRRAIIKINKVEKRFFSVCEDISKTDYFTNVYGLARSLLALGTLLSLLNSRHTIFPEYLLESYRSLRKPFYDINLFTVFEHEQLWIAQLIGIFILLLVILGFYPRITGLLHWWVSYCYYTATALPEGGDQVATIITLFLIPITLMDGRRNHWKPGRASRNGYKNFLAFCFFVLIQIQMAVVYLHAATEKMYQTDMWLDGTAMYYFANDSIYGLTEWLAFFIDPLINSPVFLSLLTWGVVIFELILFGAFFMTPKNKKRMLVPAILFHLSIIVFHGLVTFSLAMTGGLILYLLPKDKFISLRRGKIKSIDNPGS